MAEAETPAAPATSPAPPAPKARGLIRWGSLTFLVVAFLLFAFVAAGPVTKWAVEKYGTQALGTEVKLESASVNVFGMGVTLRGLRVVDPVDPSKNQFSADEVRAKIAPLGLLKGQFVVDEAALVKPRGRLVRNADGSLNGAPPEEPPPGTKGDDPAWKKKLEEQARKRDLVEDVKNVLKKVKEKRDAAVAKKEEERKRIEMEGVQYKDFKKGRADYVRGGGRPLVVVRRLLADGLVIELEDKASGAPAQTITDATLEVKEWSSAPSHHDKPMEVRLEGKLAGADASAVKLSGLLDLTHEDAESAIEAHLANLPLEKLDAFYKGAIPVAFVGRSLGTVDLPLKFKGWSIDWKPAILLDQIEAKAREPNQKIAGFEASRVAQELTNAGKLLLKDIRIHGPIWAPSIEGDVETVKALVLEGGKSYALKQGTKLLDEQKAKLLEKNPELQKKLDQTGASKVLESGEKGVGDAAKDAAEKAFDIFGGKKK